MSKTKFMVPVEALLALGIIGGVWWATGLGVGAYQKWENSGKQKRWNVDLWDRKMMERDSRLSGNVNVQVANPIAPEAFKRNSALELEKPWIS